jgi:hypothetical protein
MGYRAGVHYVEGLRAADGATDAVFFPRNLILRKVLRAADATEKVVECLLGSSKDENPGSE